MKYCTFDIESIPSQSLSEDLKSDFAATIKTGNLGPEKAQEKIDKKMSLDPDLCEVVCVSYALPGELIAHSVTDVKAVWEVIKDAYLDHIPLVSYNGIAFDLPALLHQAMRLNIPVSPQMYYDLTKKYENRYHYDLMQILAGWDKSKWKTLDFYLKLFGIGEKIGEGSEIYGWWQAGLYENIREHCEADCRLTSKLFERLATYIVKEE